MTQRAERFARPSIEETATTTLQRFSLADRFAVVTGGSRGIGLAIARGFAEAVGKVVVAARKAEACENAVGTIRSAGGIAKAVPTHVGHLEDL